MNAWVYKSKHASCSGFAPSFMWVVHITYIRFQRLSNISGAVWAIVVFVFAMVCFSASSDMASSICIKSVKSNIRFWDATDSIWWHFFVVVLPSCALHARIGLSLCALPRLSC